MFPFKKYMNGYDLCNDTVTVYHFESGGTGGAASVTRTVHARAYFEHRATNGVSKTGETEKNGFLLVIPGDTKASEVGDRVVLGEGPLVPQGDVRAWWRSFIPSKVDDLVVVGTVKPIRYGGAIVHTEASE